MNLALAGNLLDLGMLNFDAEAYACMYDHYTS